METTHTERIADLINQLKIKTRDLEFANKVIAKDKHKKECKRLMKENEDLAHLARSVMNEVTDLRTGIKTAKTVNKELYLENQAILGTTLENLQQSPEIDAFKSAHARTLAEIEETNQRSVQAAVELARAMTALKDKTEEHQELEDAVEPLKAEIRTLRAQLGKPAPERRKVVHETAAAPVNNLEIEEITQQLAAKKAECDKYAEEIRKLTLELSEMNDRAIRETMQHNTATNDLQRELEMVTESQVPKLTEELRQLQRELEVQQEQMTEVVAAEATARQETKRVQTQLDDHTAGVKAKDKKAQNNIKELKSALAKEAGQVKMLEALLAETKDQISGNQTLVICSICEEKMQVAQDEQRKLVGFGSK